MISAPLTEASFSIKSGSPYGESPIIAMIPRHKGKTGAQEYGHLFFVTQWNSSVPSPAQNSVIDVFSPVNAGTSTVAPNMARGMLNAENQLLLLGSFTHFFNPPHKYSIKQVI